MFDRRRSWAYYGLLETGVAVTADADQHTAWPAAAGHIHVREEPKVQLRGKVALVTGGARRLGRAFVLALADAGANVIIHYGHAAQEAEKTATEVRSRGAQTVTLQADLTDPVAASQLVYKASALLAPPDILVNSAAIFEPGTLQETDLRNWEAHMAVNLRAPFLLIQAFARVLGERTGKVVNVTDWRAVYPGQKYLAYTVSKAGLITLTQMAARELAPRVQVNALALGAILPPPGKDEAYLDRLVRRWPARRPARLEEVTDALLFLLRNDYITGETLFVDGGAHLVHG